MGTAAGIRKSLGGKKGGGGYLVHCPSHNDTNPSLSVKDSDDGKLILKCFAGCSKESVKESLISKGLYSPGDNYDLPKGVFSKFRNSPYRQHWTYTDKDGKIIGFVVKYQGHSSNSKKQYVPYFNNDGNGWRTGYRKSEDRPLYNLSKIAGARNAEPIYIVEGEKCADALGKIDLLATTSLGGAGAPQKTDWTILRIRRCIIWPDNDTAGKEYAKRVVELLEEAAVKRIELVDVGKLKLPEKGDCVDWIEKSNGKAEVSELPLIDAREIITNPGNILEAAKKALILGQTALEKENPAAPRPIMWPWLSARRIVEVFSERGVGKTFLGCMLTVALTRKNYMDKANDIGPWRVERPTGVLFIDGEMALHELRKRILQLATPRGKPFGVASLSVLSAEKFDSLFRGADRPLSTLNITNPQWQNAIFKILDENRRIKVLILDNISSLAPGLDENSKKDWDKIGQWLLTIRRLGVSTIFMHHAGKGGDQRGTSGREDYVDCVIKLTKPAGHKWGDPCSFNVSYGKNRILPKGATADFRSFNIRFVEADENGNLKWETSEAKNKPEMRKAAIVAMLIDNGMSKKDIAKAAGCKPPYVTEVLNNWARAKNLLDEQGKPTREGHRWRDAVNLDAVLEGLEAD